MRKLALSAVVVVSLFASRPVFAQGIVDLLGATGSAISCVPLASNTLPVPYVQTHGRVQHATSSVADVVLFCPVQLAATAIPIPTPGGGIQSPKVMTIKYIDPDASGTGANVLAELKFADAGGNMIELAVVSSSTQGSGSTGITTMDVDISDAIGKADGHLFVQLTLHRTDRSLFPTVFGYTLR